MTFRFDDYWTHIVQWIRHFINCQRKYVRFREHEILREEVKSLQDVRSRLQQRIQELEDELKKVKQDAEANAKANK